MIPCNLIVEGIGKVGKTTLIKSLIENIRGITVRNYKMPVPKCGADGYNQFDYYNYVLTTNTDIVVIFDRGHISEMVYAPTYKDYYTHEYHEFLTSIDQNIITYCKVPTYIVYVYPLWQRIMTPGNRITDDLIAVPRLYENVLYYTQLDVIRISTHSKDTQIWKTSEQLVSELLGKLYY